MSNGEIDRNKSKVLIIATSLDPKSRSFLLAEATFQEALKHDVYCRLLDLRELPLPLSGNFDMETPEVVVRMKNEFSWATHLLFAVPIYNWDVNAAAKNAMEWLTEAELAEKPVGFLCAAGGASSYMSVMSFANSLMLDFRCWIVPRIVYAVSTDFSETGVENPKIKERIAGVVQDLLRFRLLELRSFDSS